MVEDEDHWDQQNKRVKDEEGTVDDRVKQRILNTRTNVDDTELLLFVQAPVEYGGITREKQLEGFGTVVRQYIRAVRPLLTSDEVVESDAYWQEKPICSFEVPPPDGEFPWSELYRLDKTRVNRQYGFPPSFTPPKSKRFELHGLRDLLNHERIEFDWRFRIYQHRQKHGSPRHLQVNDPLPKHVYDRGIELADEFLQTVGIGVDVGFKEVDDQDVNPF